MTKVKGAGGGSPPEPFTGAGLRALIERNAVLSDNYTTPSAARLEALAERLFTLRAVYQFESFDIRRLDALPTEAAKALSTLAEVLPEILSRIDSYIRRMQEYRLEFLDAYSVLNTERAAVSNLNEAVIQANNSQFLRPAFCNIPKVEHWNSFAADIADAFRNVMEEVNPDLDRLANSNYGPVAKFIAAVVPHITCETPRVDSVARFLRRAAKGTR